MFKNNHTVLSLAIALMIVTGMFVIVPGQAPTGLYSGVSDIAGFVKKSTDMSANAQEPSGGTVAPARAWTASAPGKVEPRGGEIKISSQAPGKIIDVLVKMNDTVKAGDLLIRLDDDEARARIRAASALADARKRSRDNTDVNRLADKRRAADDKVFEARRVLRQAREDMDAVANSVRNGEISEIVLKTARKNVADAKATLMLACGELRKTRQAKKVPLETTRESALSAARAELALAEVALQRTQIRAPSDGTVLDILAKVGETVIPSPMSTLVRFGDMSSLRVRAEVEERDVGNVRVGQIVRVRSNAFPGREFSGKVTSRARTLGPNKIAAKGPRRPTDLDVLEAFIELDGMPDLLPGMRVDVYFLSDTAANKAASKSVAKDNSGTNAKATN